MTYAAKRLCRMLYMMTHRDAPCSTLAFIQHDASIISCGADPSPALLVKLISYPPGAYLQNATLLIALLSSIDHCFSDWAPQNKDGVRKLVDCM